MSPQTTTLDLALDRHVDFAHALETYLIYPWVRDGDELVRPLRTGDRDATITTARIRHTAPTTLRATLIGPALTAETVADVRAALSRCLQLDYPYQAVEALTADDPVLAAAVAHRGLGRGKLYPDIFEALCGVVCAQRTSFNRIYAMMRNLAEAFGEPTGETVDGTPIFAFPTPARMAEASDEQLRECKVGFRAKNLAAVSSTLAAAGYTWHEWRARPPAEVIPQLLEIKGVGPYTANLAVNLSYGRGGTAHVDTYVVDVIGRLYLHDPKPSPERVAEFVDQRWGELGEVVLDLLTTDTDTWVAELGTQVGVRSGARG
ncbi:DNA-3-methyladenine glycosylase family protein [Nocardia miyunensis]|uniref:DNA-3-methyladenine glycosylase family protein n=1 Tax=Nocardia miyunensis TaxID=282684 RepID=UPI00082E94E9|nr:endonuclease III domain-containing protein [Nocardia miyunensis]